MLFVPGDITHPLLCDNIPYANTYPHVTLHLSCNLGNTVTLLQRSMRSCNPYVSSTLPPIMRDFIQIPHFLIA